MRRRSPRAPAQHLLISKDALDKGKRVATRVNALAADHRREEIARMLAGAEITAEARAAAERLLKAASRSLAVHAHRGERLGRAA